MAYAAVISLKHTIKHLTSTIRPQITESAYQELNSLEDILTRLDGSSNSNINRSTISALDAEIREAAYKLEDSLQSYALYTTLPPSQDLDGVNGRPRVEPVNEKGAELEIDSFLKRVRNLEERYTKELENTDPSPEEEEEEEDADVLPAYDFGGQKSTMLGLSDQFRKIRDQLLDWQTRLKIVSIFGMAGIGKSLLTRKIHELPIVVQDFDVRVWVRLGPKPQIRSVLVDIVSQIDRKHVDLYMEEDENTLTDRIYKSLWGRKYFIVVDDIWSSWIWDHLRRLFPSDDKGSRIVLTTRVEEAAKYPATSIVYQMRFLNKEESWNLLCDRVFGGMSFPPVLEKSGRKIAELCEGLPLLILAVADILRGLEMTEAYWKEVADKKTNTFPDAYDRISKVLLSSYEYLPQYLKACFLYMGAFPQNSHVPLPKLINLWSVEDFLEPKEPRALEDFAMVCLKSIVSHSLVIVCKLSSSSIIKSCKLHSAYWYLCVKEGRKNKFLHVLSKLTDGSKDCIEGQRRLSVQNNILFGIREAYLSIAATLTAHSLLCTGEHHQYPVQICLKLMLLKVLDAFAVRLYEFPKEVLELLQLRYLALTVNGELPSSISKLQNIQSLIIRQYHNIKFLRESMHLPKEISDVKEGKSIKFLTDSACLPEEIWEIQELRHLRIMGSSLSVPSKGGMLPNLLTLCVNAHSCTEDVFTSIPKLKKLIMKIELQPDGAETLSCFEHIGLLHELKSLKCVVANPRPRSQVVAPPHHLSDLPWGLKKLSLKGLGYSWEFMKTIGLMPSLEVLKVRCYAFQGAELETESGEFKRLKFLLLEDIDLVNWTTEDDDCFPSLQHLIIVDCYKLKEIPAQIGAIRTLKTIEIIDCSSSLVASAQNIQEEEKDYGNFSLQDLISSSWNL